MWGKILTNDNLKRRGITLVDWCCLCKCSGESMDHFAIFLCFYLCCGATYFVFLDLIGRCHVEDLIYRFGAGIGLLNACPMWLLWHEKNSLTFKDMECSEG